MSAVWVLLVQTEDGSSLNAFETRAAAFDKLDEFVWEWWGDEMGDTPCPDDAEQRVAAYFAGTTGESYELARLEVATS